MAEYYQNKFMNDLGQEVVEPIGFNDMSNVTPEVIISNMEAMCEEHGIPARFRELSVEISKSI